MEEFFPDLASAGKDCPARRRDAWASGLDPLRDFASSKLENANDGITLEDDPEIIGPAQSPRGTPAPRRPPTGRGTRVAVRTHPRAASRRPRQGGVAAGAGEVGDRSRVHDATRLSPNLEDGAVALASKHHELIV